MRSALSDRRILFAGAWLVFTLSLAVWWFKLGFDQATHAKELKIRFGELDTSMEDRHIRMIVMEGVTLLAMLGVGGGALIWLLYKDRQRNLMIEDFFSTISHEMKTPLASLRLQIEALIEDTAADSASAEKPRNGRVRRDVAVHDRLQRLLQENRRIESQIGKAFYLASLMRAQQLFIENISLLEALCSLKLDWPELRFEDRDIMIRADRRALESVLRNLTENALKHGGAREVRVAIDSAGAAGPVRIQVEDDGAGFSGDLRSLGKPFVRYASSSGTGIGLYIVRHLLQRMGGSISFENRSRGFCATVELPLAVEATR